MYNNNELTTAMPKWHRFLDSKQAAVAKSFGQPVTTSYSNLSRVELRKIIIDLIG